MAREHVELVRSALDAWNRGDVDGFCDHTSEDVVWLEIAGRPESDGSERAGRERLRQGFAELFDAWESYHLDIEDVRDLGDRVLVLAREEAVGRASGMKIDGHWAYLLWVKGSEIVRVEAYRDQALAFRQI